MIRLSQIFRRYQNAFIRFIRIYWKLIVLGIIGAISYTSSSQLNYPPYLKTYGSGIIIVVFILSTTAIISEMYEITFSKKKKKVSKVIVVEKLTSHFM